jgi:acetyl esterase/lipase
LEDSALATKWVAANIAEYGGDKNKLLLMGHSAGAHIATMLAANVKYLGETRPQIKAVVGLSGPYDFVPEAQIYKDIFASAKQSNYKSAMPATYVDGTQAPMLLIYGKKDNDVGIQNLNSMQKQIADKGGELEVKIYDEMNHIETISGLSLFRRNDEMLMRILKFLGAHTE